jgi:hypothetical protein
MNVLSGEWSDSFMTDLNSILAIPELNENLTRFNLIDDICLAIWNRTAPDPDGEAIHIDDLTNTINYTLNIPVYNFIGSTTEFYSTSDKPVDFSFHDSNSNDLGRIGFFGSKNCQLIDQFTLDSPAIINIGVPHTTVNKTFFDRIILMLRLHPRFDFESFCKENN